jgi:hypothetical protein
MLDSDKKDHDDVSLLFRALQDGLFRFLKSSEQKTMFTCKNVIALTQSGSRKQRPVRRGAFLLTFNIDFKQHVLHD